MFGREFLDILACPATKQTVYLADKSVIAALNARIVQGEVTNRGAEKVEKEIVAGLICQEGTYLYPIEAGIPIMLIDRGIPLKEDNSIS